MTRIDPLRIAEIFRSLASESGGQVHRNHNDAHNKSLAANPVKEPQNHDKEVLRQRLRQRLQRLSQEDIDFSEVAPEVTIKEVLIWEFGDQVMNHPEFNLLANKVTRAMQGNEKIALQLQKLIRDMTS
jgi:hypothetical protein